MLCRLIKSEWANPNLPKVIENLFTEEQLVKYNQQGYNVYYLPNEPESFSSDKIIEGFDIKTFEWVFVDCDLKDGVYTKDSFIEVLQAANIQPTKVIDSGNGIHAYWQIINLDAIGYLRFQRRLCRLFNTDEAVSKIFQLMRVPGFINVKHEDNLVPCELLGESDAVYTAEQLDNMLPPITLEDEQYCQQHYNKTYKIDIPIEYSDELPAKFGKLLKENKEVKSLYASNTDDRSKSDYRLAHLMFAHGFNKEEAIAVLLNTAKAIERSPIHRQSYAQNIVDKIWVYDLLADKDELNLSLSVKEILQRNVGDTLKGTRFPCNKIIDNTEHGFRLGQVIGLVAGAGVGKTAFSLNVFKWFVENNPQYDHFFVSLEQPVNEIADRWQTICGENTRLHDKVHVISNYAEDGTFRRLSFEDLKQYIKKFKQRTGREIGCIVIDHIGALKGQGDKGYKDIETICHEMKGFAVETNTLLIMQSQASRDKAGIGDLELNKDSAYGTVFFESYVDYLITLWQPLKRCHNIANCPTVTAFKFCKIRNKKAKRDKIQEDVCYHLYFDPETETMRDMTESDLKSFRYFLVSATNKRKEDRKTDLVKYQSIPKEGLVDATPANSDQKSS